MAANEVGTTTANSVVPTVTIHCEGCRRPLGACTIRVGPSARQSGWRCGRAECAPGRDEAPVAHTGADANTLTMETTALRSGGQNDSTP